MLFYLLDLFFNSRNTLEAINPNIQLEIIF